MSKKHSPLPRRVLAFTLVLLACEGIEQIQAPCEDASAEASPSQDDLPSAEPAPDLPAAHLDEIRGGDYADTVSVRTFGVRGDGSSDDSNALQNAIDRVSSGTALYFPSGTYVLRSRVELRGGVALVSKDAVLDTRSNDGTALLLRDGTGVEISGLAFRGPTSAGGYSRAIEIRSGSSRNLIRGNRFDGYDGGAIVVAGDGNTIVENVIRGANNAPPEGGAHYGSIHVINSERNIVARNEITEFEYSGISVYGATDNRIAGNTIHTREGFPGNSMGIYMLAGAAENLVEKNVVTGARWEGIVLISNDRGPVEGNVVRDNDVADCLYAGISLQKNGSHGVTDNWIEDNRIEALGLPSGQDLDHAILVVGARRNTFRGNEVRSDGNRLQAGIRMLQEPRENFFEGNHIVGASQAGIFAVGADSHWIDNTVRGVVRGIVLERAPGSIVAGNRVSQTSKASIEIGDDVAGARVFGNDLDRPISGNTGGVDLDGNDLIECRE